MNLGDWIAVYGALLSTTLAIRELRKGRSSVKVSFSVKTMLYPSGETRPAIVIDVINRSDYKIKITALAFEREDGMKMYLFDQLPAEILPHDSRSFPFWLADLSHDDLKMLSVPLCSYVQLSTGEEYRSKRQELRLAK